MMVGLVVGVGVGVGVVVVISLGFDLVMGWVWLWLFLSLSSPLSLGGCWVAVCIWFSDLVVVMLWVLISCGSDGGGSMLFYTLYISI